VGSYTLVYRICEIASPSNCDDGTVTVTVREPFVIDAVNDSGSTVPGWTAVANVLVNDMLNGTAATPARVTLSMVSSTSTGVQLNAATGAIVVLAGTVPGAHRLTYRICEIASPTNCDDATVAVTVIPFAIDAVNDVGFLPRSGGIAVANVLANDSFNGAIATVATVRLAQVSSSHAGVSLNVATGAVSVTAGTPVGGYMLNYRICEIAAPANCDAAAVSVTVTPLQITAVDDNVFGSSKLANTALASVLANDWLGNARRDTGKCEAPRRLADAPPTARFDSISQTGRSTFSAKRAQGCTRWSMRSAKLQCRPTAAGRPCGSI
jgi:large repetitive protein